MWDHDLISSCWQSDLLLTEASLRGMVMMLLPEKAI